VLGSGWLGICILTDICWRFGAGVGVPLFLSSSINGNWLVACTILLAVKGMIIGDLRGFRHE